MVSAALFPLGTMATKGRNPGGRAGKGFSDGEDSAA